EDDVLDLIRKAEVFLCIRSSELATCDSGREELLARQVDQARATGSRIVVVEVLDRLDRRRSQAGATKSSSAGGDHSALGRYAGESDMTFCSVEPSETALRSLLGVTLSRSLRLDQDLSDFTVTVAEWRRLLGGVRAAAGVDLTGPPDSDTASWMRLRAESAHVSGAQVMAMCDELPDVTHQSMARRAIVVGLLRSMARNTDGRAPTDVRPLWRLLRPTLDVSSGIPIRATVGSQGFYVIP